MQFVEACILPEIGSRLLRTFLILNAVLIVAGQTNVTVAAEFEKAQVTQIVKDVDLLPGQASARRAALHDNVREGMAVRTGTESRTELTFTDQTLTRLGANTLFSFREGTRNLDLGGGAMLISVPKDARSATVRTAAVTAAVTGGTSLLEHHQKAVAKFICLEGLIRLVLKASGESVTILPGQMLVVPPDARRLSRPVHVDLKTIVETSPLFTDFPPLPNAGLIAQEIAKQEKEKADGQLVAEDESATGPGEPTMWETIDQKSNVGGGAGAFNPIKFGPLNTITMPAPYVINSGTLIQTDPFIMTNGQTDFGRIYRAAADGPPSDYFFGSTSAFDATSDINVVAELPTTQQIATFKFTSLQFSGPPAISLGNGGPSALALISEGAITSGAPGGTVTFPNLDFVLLATQNASINLGGTISFANIPQLQMYARGAVSNLTLASPMMGMGTVNLAAEGSLQINADENLEFLFALAGTDFLSGTGLITANQQILIRASNLNFSMAQFALAPGAIVSLGLTNTNTVNIDASANPTLFANAGGVDVTAANNINISGGTTMTFGSLTFATFQAGPGGISASTMSFSHPGGTLSFSSDGDITVNSIIGGLNISALGNITSNGDIAAARVVAGGTINVTGGSLTATQLVQSAMNLTVFDALTALEVEVGGNTVSADHASILLLNQSLGSNNTTLSVLNPAGAITPYLAAGPGALHVFNVNTIMTSLGGIDFNGNNYSAPRYCGWVSPNQCQ